MYAPYCPRHGSRVLLSWPRLRWLENTPEGIELTFECYCGEHVEVLTGRLADAPPTERTLTDAAANR